MKTTTLYFAYGSNLSKNGMSHRCPGSRPVGTAILNDYRLTFRGVADVEPSPGDIVFGAVWRCPIRDIASLDIYEGVRGGFYRREYLTVEMEEGPVRALVYIMNPTPLDNRSVPSQGYYGTIVAGYHDFGLPLAALTEALEQTMERVHGKGIRDFTPHGPKRLGPAGTRRVPRKVQKAARKKQVQGVTARAVQRDLTIATSTGSGRHLRPLRGEVPGYKTIGEAILEGSL